MIFCFGIEYSLVVVVASIQIAISGCTGSLRWSLVVLLRSPRSAMKCRLCNLEMSKHDYYSEHKKTCEDRFGVGSTTVRSGSSSSSSSSSTDYASRRENSVSFELGNKKQANQAAAAALNFLPPSAMPARRAVSQPASQPPTGGVHAKLNHHYSTLLRITPVLCATILHPSVRPGWQSTWALVVKDVVDSRC